MADSMRVMELLGTTEHRGKRLEVILIGCGTPKFSMGWTHLYQMLQEPLVNLADVVGVVEPYFMSETGKNAKGSDVFNSYTAEHPEIKFVSSCDQLPAVTPGKARVAIIAVRTGVSCAAFEDAVLKLGCRAIYLEKPGASNVQEMDRMIKIAEENGVTVVVGYSRNVGTYVSRGREFPEKCEAATSTKPSVKLLHSNPWKDEDMAECFQRCQPGIMYDMACHDLAIAVAFYGLTADGYTDLNVDPTTSLQAMYGGIDDFVRLSFSLCPKAGKNPIHFMIDRQSGSFNGMEVNGRRFLCGEPPLLFENPLDDLSSHLAVQYDYYVEAKRILLTTFAASPLSLKRAVELPLGVPTLKVAREVLLLAKKLTKELKTSVPKK